MSHSFELNVEAQYLSPDLPKIPPELLEKSRPKQQRAIFTYERILSSAAELLEEVGVERISTNLIAQRAEVTVPAVYRYFSNKFAVLFTLGARLMDKQNEVLLRWHESYFTPGDNNMLIGRFEEVIRDTFEVTRQQQAGLQILLAMRVVPVLQEVRLQSHKTMANWMVGRWQEHIHIPDPQKLALQGRLAMEISTAAVEMALEDPDMPAELAITEAARALRLYWREVMYDLDHPSVQ